MSYVKEKVSYLRGLFDGLELEESSQTKLFNAMIDVMDSIADAIDDNEATIDELDECISDIYDSLEEVEEDFYGLLNELDELDEMDDEEDDDNDEFPFDEDDFIEVQCPNCDDIIYFDQEMLSSKEDLICPSCNKNIIPAEITEDKG